MLKVTEIIKQINVKALFYPLFDSLEQQLGNKVTVFEQHNKRKKETGSSLVQEPGTVMVETGEG